LGLSSPHLIDRLGQFSFGQYKIANFEMETAGIYGLGKMLGHHCLSLSAIVANRVAKKFSSDPQAAMEKLIEQTLEIVTSM
jgi:uridine phosphorylase